MRTIWMTALLLLAIATAATAQLPHFGLRGIVELDSEDVIDQGCPGGVQLAVLVETVAETQRLLITFDSLTGCRLAQQIARRSERRDVIVDITGTFYANSGGFVVLMGESITEVRSRPEPR